MWKCLMMKKLNIPFHATTYRYEDNWIAGLTWDFQGPEFPFEGCMDIEAINYNPNALFSDDSCEYVPKENRNNINIIDKIKFSFFI